MTNPNPAAPLTDDPYRDEREHERQSNAGSHLFDSACYFCLRDFWMQHEEDAARATSTPPEGTRLVLVSDGLFEALGADRVEWGEPDANGWYTPTLTRATSTPAGLFADSQKFYNAGHAAGWRAALQAVVDLPTVVPDHAHGGVRPPYLEWNRVAAMLRAALQGADR